MAVKHVDGKKSSSIMLYALSTCGWCKKTKGLLGELGVEYEYIDVDLLSGAEKKKVMKDVEKWNPGCSFPTMVVNNRECIVGFDEGRIRKAAGQ
jgi:glutaredoxin